MLKYCAERGELHAHTLTVGKVVNSCFLQHPCATVPNMVCPFSKLTLTNFEFQLEKVYDPKNEEDDMVEMEEERLRMREHVMNEVGTDSQ